ncbi:multidrug DMT transporter permease, partial [Micromonospora ureilytica]
MGFDTIKRHGAAVFCGPALWKGFKTTTMTLGPLLLLLSALLHAAWNGLAKASKDKESFLFLTSLLSGLLTAASLPISGTGFIFPDNRAFAIAV